MKVFQLLACLILMVPVNKSNIHNGEIFLTRPGDGEEYVYSPVGVKVTLHCAVNNSFLVWKINEMLYSIPPPSLILRGILFEIALSSDGKAKSSLLVTANVSVNNNTKICCKSLMELDSCTTLIIFDRPFPPENVSVQFRSSFESVSISWNAKSMTGVNETHQLIIEICTLNFTTEVVLCSHQNCTINTELFNVGNIIQHYYIYRQSSSDSKITCSAYVTAINEAGESEPSNNVSIPSLPDIGPVISSLSHQVWKSTGGIIMVNIMFKPALQCASYPVSSYLLHLKSEKTQHTFEKILSFASNNITRLLSAQVRLKGNEKYVYAVTATNNVGNSTTAWTSTYLLTSDLQSVIATVWNESSVHVQCLFIHGSDAVGCKVVLVSNYPGVNNETKTLIRNNTSAFGQIKSTQHVSCYHKVLASTEPNATDITNNLIIVGKMLYNHTGRNIIACSEKYQPSSLKIVIVIIVITILFIFFLVIFVICLTISIIMKKKREMKNAKNKKCTKNICYVSTTSRESNVVKVLTSAQNESTLLQSKESDESINKGSMSFVTQVHSPKRKSPNDSIQSTNEQNLVTIVSVDSITPSKTVPLYAVPEDLKTNRDPKGKVKEENVKSFSVNDEEKYHVSQKGLRSSIKTQTESTTDNLSSTFILSDHDDCQIVSTDYSSDAKICSIPLYAIPDKIKSKSQSNCDDAVQINFREQNDEEKEHVYHILENS